MIKKILIFVGYSISIFLSSIACGQEYIPMNFEDSFWYVNHYWHGGFQSNNHYYCIGDTIINDTTFNKLFVSSISVVPGGGPDTTIHSYEGAIAEFPDKTVRFLFSGEVHSTKIYDFNLEIGDTIYCLIDKFVINSIDSVLICGAFHKRYIHMLNPAEITLTEGIGLSSGLLGFRDCEFGLGENESSLVCYFEKSNTTCESCPFVVGIGQPELNAQVYPNPTSGIVNIKTEKMISEIEVFNLFGRKVSQLKNLDENFAELNISTLENSVYILKVKFTDNTFNIKHIIKTDQ